MATKGAGQLRERVAFDAPVVDADGIQTGWAAPGVATERWAEFIYQRGSESVDAARLSGKAIYKLRLHQSSAARGISTDWRMRDLRRGTEYQVREVDAISDRRWIYIVVESGVAI